MHSISMMEWGGEEANARRTARSIANVINNKSNLVFANVDGTRISFDKERRIEARIIGSFCR